MIINNYVTRDLFTRLYYNVLNIIDYYSTFYFYSNFFLFLAFFYFTSI